MKYRRPCAKNPELVTVKQAIAMVQEFFHSETPVISAKTIYNKIWDDSLKRYGTRHRAMLDKNEVISKFCRHYGQ